MERVRVSLWLGLRCGETAAGPLWLPRGAGSIHSAPSSRPARRPGCPGMPLPAYHPVPSTHMALASSAPQPGLTVYKIQRRTTKAIPGETLHTTEMLSSALLVAPLSPLHPHPWRVPAGGGGRAVPASLMFLGTLLLLFLDRRRAIGWGPVGEGDLVRGRF